MFIDGKSEQRVSKCITIPSSSLLKSILDRYRPDRHHVFYLNLYNGQLSAIQESSILLKYYVLGHNPILP